MRLLQTIFQNRSSTSPRDTSSETPTQPCFRMNACGSLAMNSSSSMSPRSPLQFQLLSLSVFQLLPPSLLPKLFQPRRLRRVEFPFPLQRRCLGIVITILLRRLALIVSHRRSGGFLAFRQWAVNEGVSKNLLSQGLVLDCGDPID